MQRLVKISAALWLMCYNFVVFAASASEQLTRLLMSTNSMQANFRQLVIDRSGRVINQSEGHMALMRPGKFRWETTKPTAQLVVTDGKRIWVYDPDLEQVTIRLLTHTAGEAPALLLSHTNTAIVQDFTVQRVGNTFLLKPKDRNSLFEAIKISFAGTQVKAMQLQDHLGHRTHIELSRVQVNRQLPANLFVFNVPPHIDMIDETRVRR